jgi:hypothetical protein
MLSFFRRQNYVYTYKYYPNQSNGQSPIYTYNTYTYDTNLKKYIQKIETDLLEKQNLNKLGLENMYYETTYNNWNILVGLSFLFLITYHKLVNSKLLNN